MEFEERTIRIVIDTEKCPECSSKACIDACSIYSRGILKLHEGKPSISHLSSDEVKRKGTECLACEYACWQRGLNAIRIEIPIKGLDEYLRKSAVLDRR
jgi:Fe-S-cluster-containing dehydrogenase component